MAAPRPTTLMTAEQLFELPDDDLRHELVEGELIVMSPAGRRHGLVGLRCAWKLAEFVEERALGEVHGADTGFILRRKPDTVRAPDAAFISRDRVAPLTDSREDDLFLELAPDLAVEVVSPSDTAREMSGKVVGYLDAGTQQVWVVEPRKRIVTVYTANGMARLLGEGDAIDGGELLPGFRLELTELFR